MSSWLIWALAWWLPAVLCFPVEGGVMGRLRSFHKSGKVHPAGPEGLVPWGVFGVGGEGPSHSFGDGMEPRWEAPPNRGVFPAYTPA